ncbi:alanine racemase [Conexibacter arvalis]|uniref:Alanine racemase n=1 Tax=Conexibacter arvalis TaxID=912552 RepID=A0A840II30_9ACTN|nr:alanine racemase [Conexibacter arvalis]MBB4663620.1 alanine racemase [Conexibacter arvalis]
METPAVDDAPRAAALVNLTAVERNVATLRGRLRPGAVLCAVVKADGYGHGAAPVARAALAGGAEKLAVVTAGEATALRAAGVDAPLIVLGPLRGAEVAAVVATGAEPVISTDEEIDALEADGRPVAVHLKLDSGMGRLGERDPELALERCARVGASATLRLAGVMTHFATADVPGDAAFARQLETFARFAERARAAHPGIVVHAANSAATLAEPASHFDMVRTGVAIYGLDPFGADPAANGLEPALTWTSRLAAVKRIEGGGSVGYGRRWVAAAPTTIGTVAVGYADGVRRALGFAQPPTEVLVGGRRVPLAGTVSMDSFGVELPDDLPARPGDRVTLIGADGGERVTAEELAARLQTINYEIACGISARVPRVYHRDGAVVDPA